MTNGKTDANKKVSIKYVLARLWKYLAKHKRKLAASIALMMLSNLFALLIPLLSGRAIDAIGILAGRVDFAKVFLNCALMLACYLASSIFSYWLSVWLIKISQDVSRSLRKDIFETFVRLPVSFYDRHPVGDMISCICYDVDTINASLSTDFVQIVSSVFTVVGSLFMLLMLSPLLSIIIIITLPITTLFSRWQMKRMHGFFRTRSQKLGELNGLTEESVSAQKSAAVFGCEEALINRFENKNAEAIEAYYIADFKSCLLGPMVNFFNNISLSLGSALGAILCLLGKLSLGAVSSFVLYSRKFSGPIREAANIASEIQAAIAAAERVFRMIDEPLEASDKPNATPLSTVHGDVTMNDVCFRYDEDKEILKSLSLNVRRGSVIAIVGPTGAGKTTIVNLLMRFYDIQSGRIAVDGVDVRDAVRKDLRLAYAMVLQDTWLFHGTIYENIAYGSKMATREQVIAAAKAAKIHRFICSLPNGYDTILANDSVNISKGQKQLMTIARAMLIDANMLILDEATSNVDTNTEMEINDAMKRLMKDKTCFVIAHRLSTIENADCILVMDNGRLVEQGTHAELMAKKGFYYSLYNAQF